MTHMGVAESITSRKFNTFVMPNRILLCAFISFALYLISLHNYLLFHTLVEMFSIVVSYSIFVLAWNCRDRLDNSYLLLMGIAFLFIGCIDLVHTLAYTGMGVFPGYGSNLPAQLWIAARYVQGVSFLIAPITIGRRIKVGYLLVGYATITSILLASIFSHFPFVFPECYAQGLGLTAFKKVSEYIISATLLVSLVLLIQKKKAFDKNVSAMLGVSLLICLGSEVMFTLYTSVYDIFNMAGHILKILSFYFLYLSIVQTGLVKPYDLIFKSLKQSEERFRGIADISVDTIFQINGEGRFAYVSPAVERIMGYKPEEMIGKSIPDFMEDKENTDAIQRFTGILKGQVISGLLISLRRKDGSYVPVEVNAAPVHKESEIVGLEGVARDVTDRRRLEEMKDQFISAITHELRTPLASTKGYVDYVLEGKAGPVPEKIRSSLEVAKRNADRLVNLTDDLLDLRRMESGRFKMNMEPLNLLEIVNNSAKEAEPFISEKKQVLRVEVPDQRVFIKGDKVRLAQVLMNLLSNASKFTPEGGDMALRLTVEEDAVRVQVSDTGIGIKKDDLDRVFEPFAAIQKPTYIKGTGLGLSVAKGLVEAHGGRIWAESSGEGKGAIFTFTLPKCKEEVNYVG